MSERSDAKIKQIKEGIEAVGEIAQSNEIGRSVASQMGQIASQMIQVTLVECLAEITDELEGIKNELIVTNKELDEMRKTLKKGTKML